MSELTKLAYEALDELSATDPEVSWSAIEDAVFAKMAATDIDVLKRLAAHGAVVTVRKSVTDRIDLQIPLPGMPPAPDAYLEYEHGKAIKAGKAKLSHIDQAGGLRRKNVNHAVQKMDEWFDRVIPIYPYLATGMEWDAAAAAYARDHDGTVLGLAAD